MIRPVPCVNLCVSGKSSGLSFARVHTAHRVTTNSCHLTGSPFRSPRRRSRPIAVVRDRPSKSSTSLTHLPTMELSRPTRAHTIPLAYYYNRSLILQTTKACLLDPPKDRGFPNEGNHQKPPNRALKMSAYMHLHFDFELETTVLCFSHQTLCTPLLWTWTTLFNSSDHHVRSREVRFKLISEENPPVRQILYKPPGFLFSFPSRVASLQWSHPYSSCQQRPSCPPSSRTGSTQLS